MALAGMSGHAGDPSEQSRRPPGSTSVLMKPTTMNRSACPDTRSRLQQPGNSGRYAHWEITSYMLTSDAHGDPLPTTSGPRGADPGNTTGLGKTVAFRTIGCKLNQCETAQMQETLLAEGFRLVGWDSAADIRVVNTCTVTAKSDRTCRHEIRQPSASIRTAQSS